MTEPTLRRIHPPDSARLTPAEAAAQLGLEALARDDRPYVLVNMVASNDGKVTVGGRSGSLGNEADKQLFHALRTQVDAVMVGAGTLRVERYGRLVRDPALRERRIAAGLAEDPLAIVVSGSLALAGDLPLFQAPEQRVVVLTEADGEIDGAAARVEYLRARPLELAPALRELRERHGVRTILCEGGPTLNSRLLEADLVDEWLLSLAPLLVGGSEVLTAVAGTSLDEVRRMELVWALEGASYLFLRYRLRRA